MWQKIRQAARWFLGHDKNGVAFKPPVTARNELTEVRMPTATRSVAAPPRSKTRSASPMFQKDGTVHPKKVVVPTWRGAPRVARVVRLNGQQVFCRRLHRQSIFQAQLPG